MGQTWTPTTDGTTQELTTQQALEHQMFKRVLDGDHPSIKTVLKWIKKREKARDTNRRRHQRKNPRPIKQVYLEDVGGRSKDALLLLDIIEPYRPVPDPEVPDKFLIRPWAAQLAIGRHRRLNQLDDNDIKLIRCQVADAGELNLPGGVLGR